MKPGECRFCGTTTREHANNCQYVAIKDNIGLCTYCQAQDHRYIACPQWAVDQETAAREKRKNKKNNKKRKKVKIVAGIMTRQEESDSTQSHEKEEGGIGTPSPQRFKRKKGVSASIAWWVHTTTEDSFKKSDVFLLWG